MSFVKCYVNDYRVYRKNVIHLLSCEHQNLLFEVAKYVRGALLRPNIPAFLFFSSFILYSCFVNSSDSLGLEDYTPCKCSISNELFDN